MIYLDNSATTRPFDRVIDAMDACMRTEYFNASAAYKPALNAEKRVRACRQLIAAVLGAQENEIYFTSGGTESDNLAIMGVAQTLRKPANFVCSAVEHPAVLETIERVRALGHEVRVLPVDSRGIVDLRAAEELCDEQTALVSCMQVCNETGAIQPVEALSRLAKRKNPKCVMHVDGVQGFMRVPMQMGRMGIDCYALSGHKIHGPKGIGVLAVRQGVRLAAQTTGGGQEKNLRSGTTNTPGIVGLHEAVEEMRRRQGEIAEMSRMKAALLALLREGTRMQVNGPAPQEDDSAPHILSVSFEGVRGEVMRNALEGAGILVSTGSACSSHKQKTSATLRAMGLTGERADGTIRVSLGLMNTMEEMEEAARQMVAVSAMLSGYRRR